jgi:hypothetical protein
LALGPAVRATTFETELAVSHGTILDAVATLKICHHDRSGAERLISAACTGVRRLERLFSLYLDDSDPARA